MPIPTRRCCSRRSWAIRRSRCGFAARATWHRIKRPPPAIHGAIAHRRDAGLRQSGRVRRRRYRLQFQQYADEQKEDAEGQAPPAPGPGVNVPQTTFDPLSTTQFSAPAKPTTMQPLAAPAAALPPAPVVYPAKAAARPGAVLPPPVQPVPISNVPPEVYPLAAAHRAGGTVPVPPPIDADASVATPPPGTQPLSTLPLGTRAQRLLPLGDGDPYSPLGIRGGSFIFFPAVELSTAYASNPQHIPHGAGSPYFVVAPELLVQSDWSRHSLTATIAGSYTDYTNDSFVPSLNRPYLNSKIDGRIDVTRDTQIVLENRLLVSTDNPGSPNLQAGSRQPADRHHGRRHARRRAEFQPADRVAQGHLRPRAVPEFHADRRRDREQCRSRSQPICRHRACRLRARSRRQAVRGSAAGCPRLR